MKATTAARMATALGATLVVVTGCAPAAPPTAGTVSLGDVRSSATASQTVSARSPVKVFYRSWGFTARRPDAWRSYPYEFIGTLGGTIGYLSTDTLRNPCRRTANSISCAQQSVLTRLSSNGVLIRWDELGRPGIDSISDFPGDPLAVGDSPARLEKPRPATGVCLVEGGAVQIQGTVLRPDAGENFIQMNACLGPDVGSAAELDADALFRSVEFVGG